jgi:hypothetical protein
MGNVGATVSIFQLAVPDALVLPAMSVWRAEKL